MYWYHQLEKRSVWEKPTELKTAREKAIDSTQWKEYQSGERKYYVHSVTKQSSWSLPKELQDLFDSIPDETGSNTPPVQQSVQSPMQRPTYSGPPPGFASSPQNLAHGSASPLPSSSTTPALEPPSIAARPMPVSVSNVSLAGGEEAFIHLLRDRGVDETWTWEQTMREIITDPLYKALKTLAERKAAFSKYHRSLQEEASKVRAEKVKAIEPSVRKAIDKVIAAGSRIEHWLSYEGMLLRCPDASAWRKLEAVGKEEARKLWTAIAGEMREKDTERKREVRRSSKKALMDLLRSFEADVQTRWKDARQTILESEEWQADENLRRLETTEMLNVFDELMQALAKEREEELQHQSKEKKRNERKRRDWFRSVLREGKREGWLTVRTTFVDVLKRCQGQEEFRSMLGQAGSSPVDLFYDVLDDLERVFDGRIRDVEDVLGDEHRVSTSTTFEHFLATFRSALDSTESAAKAGGLKKMSEGDLKQIYEELSHRAKEDARRAERKLRHLDEDLRYALKKVAYHRPETFSDEQSLDDSWDTWKPKISALQIKEWEAFEKTSFRFDAARIDDARRAAWERFVKRQKEKLIEAKERVAAAMAGDSRKRRTTDDGDVGDIDDAGHERAKVARKGEDDKQREINRRERRAGMIDEPASAAANRMRKTSDALAANDDDSEKEEGEV